MLIITLALSQRAIDIWNDYQEEQKADKKAADLESISGGYSSNYQDRHYNFGYRRVLLMATFLNCVFIIFSTTFDWLENVHHLIEHWEKSMHSQGTLLNQDIHKSQNSRMTHQGLNSYHETPANHNASNMTAKEIANIIDSEHNNHQNDTQFFISVFALIRLALFSFYLYLEYTQGPPLYTYMNDNWLGHPYRFSVAMKQSKIKTRECLRWDGLSFL